MTHHYYYHILWITVKSIEMLNMQPLFVSHEISQVLFPSLCSLNKVLLVGMSTECLSIAFLLNYMAKLSNVTYQNVWKRTVLLALLHLLISSQLKNRTWNQAEIFWVVALCRVEVGCWCFGRWSCLHLQGENRDGGSKVLQNVGILQ